MIRIRRVSSFGGPAQYRGFLARTIASSCSQLTNFQGPLPMGCWSKSSGVGLGATAATGMARSLGKTLSGSVKVKTMVESSGTSIPSTRLAWPSA